MSKLLSKTLFFAALLCLGSFSWSSEVVPFSRKCNSLFKPFMSKLPQWETLWEAQETISHTAFPSLRQYSGVHYGKNDSKVYVKEVLPSVVKKTLGKDLNINSFSAVMNFYFPGFGLKPLQANGLFYSLIGTTFRALDHHGSKKEELRPGDLVVIKKGATINHAMVFIGNGMVWQKPHAEIPAGFYNMTDTIFSFIKGSSSSEYAIEYYRFELGSSTDHYSPKIFQSIREGNTQYFFE